MTDCTDKNSQEQDSSCLFDLDLLPTEEKQELREIPVTLKGKRVCVVVIQLIDSRDFELAVQTLIANKRPAVLQEITKKAEQAGEEAAQIAQMDTMSKLLHQCEEEVVCHSVIKELKGFASKGKPLLVDTTDKVKALFAKNKTLKAIILSAIEEWSNRYNEQQLTAVEKALIKKP